MDKRGTLHKGTIRQHCKAKHDQVFGFGTVIICDPKKAGLTDEELFTNLQCYGIIVSITTKFLGFVCDPFL